MNRIETAIQQASCVFVLGDNATSPEVQHELSARNIPYCLLDPSEEAESTESTAAPQALSVDALGPALNSRSSGMIVVVAPSFMETGLDTLAGIVAAAQSRPRLFFVTKAMNKSALPSQLRSWKIQQIKWKNLKICCKLFSRFFYKQKCKYKFN